MASLLRDTALAPRVTDLGDHDLAARAQGGDRAAFATLITRYQDAAYGVTLRILGNVEDARDACQNGFLKVWGSLDRYDLSQPFQPWLLRVMANQALDLLRQRRRRRPSFGVATSMVVAVDPADDLRLSLEQVLNRLSPRQRAALVLRDLEGLSTAEVARALGCTAATVRVLLHQARHRARTLIEEDS